MAGEVEGLDQRFVRETGVAAEIAGLAEPVLDEIGFRLVRVLVSGSDGGTVQLMADRADGPITADDCARISRRLAPVLDARDPIPSRYILEVSTPGIDRPLVRPSDFQNWVGHEAKIELRESLDGRKRFRGEIEALENGEVRLRLGKQAGDEPSIVRLPVDLIGEAKLILSDDLIKAAFARKPA